MKMKIWGGLVLSGLLFCSAHSRAEIQQGDQFVKISGGGIWPLGELKDKADFGFVFGVDYRYQLWDPLSLGGTLAFANFTNRSLSHNLRYQLNALTLGAFLRFDLMPYKWYHPYARGGPTHNILTAEIIGTDTNRNESANQTGAFGALGVDFDYGDFGLWGFEGRYDHLGPGRDAIAGTLSVSFRFG